MQLYSMADIFTATYYEYYNKQKQKSCSLGTETDEWNSKE